MSSWRQLKFGRDYSSTSGYQRFNIGFNETVRVRIYNSPLCFYSRFKNYYRSLPVVVQD